MHLGGWEKKFSQFHGKSFLIGRVGKKIPWKIKRSVEQIFHLRYTNMVIRLLCF